MVDDLYFWYCVEDVIVCREGTDALAEVTDRMRIYLRRELLAHRPMIMIVSGCTLSR